MMYQDDLKVADQCQSTESPKLHRCTFQFIHFKAAKEWKLLWDVLSQLIWGGDVVGVICRLIWQGSKRGEYSVFWCTPIFQDLCYCLSEEKTWRTAWNGFWCSCDDGGYTVGTASSFLNLIWACYFFCVVWGAELELVTLSGWRDLPIISTMIAVHIKINCCLSYLLNWTSSQSHRTFRWVSPPHSCCPH